MTSIFLFLTPSPFLILGTPYPTLEMQTSYVIPSSLLRMTSFEDDDAACERPVLTMRMESLDNFSVVYWSGDEANHDMSIETYKEGRIRASI